MARVQLPYPERKWKGLCTPICKDIACCITAQLLNNFFPGLTFIVYRNPNHLIRGLDISVNWSFLSIIPLRLLRSCLCLCNADACTSASITSAAAMLPSPPLGTSVGVSDLSRELLRVGPKTSTLSFRQLTENRARSLNHPISRS